MDIDWQSEFPVSNNKFQRSRFPFFKFTEQNFPLLCSTNRRRWRAIDAGMRQHKKKTSRFSSSQTTDLCMQPREKTSGERHSVFSHLAWSRNKFLVGVFFSSYFDWWKRRDAIASQMFFFLSADVMQQSKGLCGTEAFAEPNDEATLKLHQTILPRGIAEKWKTFDFRLRIFRPRRRLSHEIFWSSDVAPRQQKNGSLEL